MLIIHHSASTATWQVFLLHRGLHMMDSTHRAGGSSTLIYITTIEFLEFGIWNFNYCHFLPYLGCFHTLIYYYNRIFGIWNLEFRLLSFLLAYLGFFLNIFTLISINDFCNLEYRISIIITVLPYFGYFLNIQLYL